MKFPANFSIGAASSAYQIEGGWNASGMYDFYFNKSNTQASLNVCFVCLTDKGINIWDWYIHEKPWTVFDGSNGNVACDSYHNYKQDVAYLKDLGVSRSPKTSKRLFYTLLRTRVKK